MMGAISGTSIVSLMVLLGEGNKLWCPLEDGLWKDALNRAAPEKDGTAIPGEWARLGQKRRNAFDHSDELLFCVYVVHFTQQKMPLTSDTH